MKKILLFLLLLCIATGCTKHQPREMQMEVDVSGVTEGMKVSEFSLDLVLLHITYPSGEEETIPLSASMLYQSDLNKLSRSGAHTITIQYKTTQKQITITLAEDEGSGQDDPSAITITGPRTVQVDQSITLVASVEPPTAPQTITWESTNEQIATVNAGVVTGHQAGSVTIRAASVVLPTIVEEVMITVIAQPTDDYETYYDNAEGLTGSALKQALHNIIDDHTSYTYDFARTALAETDEDPNNSNNVILMYTGRSQAKSTFGSSGDDWNREHTWPKSHGGFGETKPMGTDLHHLRPTDASVNSTRGNFDFDEGGSKVNDEYGTGSTYCYYDSDSFEPRDEVKGDVARIIFYMAVRYEGDKSGELDLEIVDRVNTSGAVLGKLSTLLRWNEEDPVDEFERTRNNVIYGYQNNRNPFIDHPEFADMIWSNDSVKTSFELKVYQIAAIVEEKNDYISI